MPEIKAIYDHTSGHRTIGEFYDAYNAGTYDARHYGVKDSKGRVVGASVQTFAVTLRDATPEDIETRARSTYRVPAGTYYIYTPHALRDGRSFGALQGYRWFTTEAERDAAVAKYFRDAEKRASKVRT